MQIQINMWESCSSGASRPSWHQVFLVPFLTVPGLLGGEKASSAAKPFLSTAHARREEETSTLWAGGVGKLGLETRPAPSVGGAACPLKQGVSEPSARQRSQLPLSDSHLLFRLHDSTMEQTSGLREVRAGAPPAVNPST